jgi:hypothetical protein
MPKTEKKEAENTDLLTLAEKLVRIRQSIGGLSKDAKADRYDYVSGSQVLGKILATMNDLGVLLIPKPIHNTERWESHQFERKGKYDIKIITDYIVTCQMFMVWMDAKSKETIEVPWLLYGEQEGDIAKAFGSGLTYAERYFIMKFFNQPTDYLDPDAGKGEPPEDVKAQEEAEKIGNEFMDKVQESALMAKMGAKNVSVPIILKQYNIESLDELRKKDWMDAMARLDATPDRPQRKGVEGI